MPPDQLIDIRPPDDGGWTQITIEFSDWPEAEVLAVRHLAPVLRDRPDAAHWWFVRKRPCWRLRYRPFLADTDRDVADAMDTLAADGVVHRWHHAVYEAEQVAFGGPDGMDAAHQLFHDDSRAVIYLLHHPPAGLPGRRESTVLAVSALLRAAGLDWYEQGDVWATVAAHRPTRTPPPPISVTAATAMRRLLTLDSPAALVPDPLGPWLASFDTAGHRLGNLARTGRLRRGLRAVLAHHVIFHWNRLGLPYADQRTLAVLACDTIMDGSGQRCRHDH